MFSKKCETCSALGRIKSVYANIETILILAQFEYCIQSMEKKLYEIIRQKLDSART